MSETSHSTATAASRQRSGAKSRGFSLIEVLIAMFVLSTMTLGALALHEVSLSSSLNSDHRTSAQRLAEEFIQFYTLYTTGGSPQSVLDNFIFDDTDTPYAGTCNSNAIVGDLGVNDTLNNFLACWRANVGSRLPSGRARAEKPDSGSPIIFLEILWGAGNPRQQVRVLGG